MRWRARNWWLRRGWRFWITLFSAIVSLVFLGILAVFAGRYLEALLIDSVDDELRTVRASASERVSAGEPISASQGVRVSVLDIAGKPVIGQRPAGLTAGQVAALKAGVAVRSDDGRVGPPVRWLGSVVTAPDGTQRLVVVGAGLAGTEAAADHGARWLLVGAGIGAVTVAVATWFGVRSALRPVAKMRRSVRSVPFGKRLELPQARDELRSLATEFNALLERQERANDRLRRFTGDAAHELRSPVASIRVQAEVAVANPDPDLARETLADVLEETERLSVLLDGLLALARSDAGELGYAEPVELVREVRAAIGRLPSGGPEVRIAGVSGEFWALATHAEVELVLDNLLRNAARYARAQIVVSMLSVGSWTRLIVDDDGNGIAEEHRELVLDRFYRVADDRARSSGGSGLGLAMVAEVVRRRGGKVLVSESPEGGARFQVTWLVGHR